jgi:hypothetical protein
MRQIALYLLYRLKKIMKNHVSQKNKIVHYPNLAQILKPYEHKWVALSPDYQRVISSGDTLARTREQVRENEREKVIFHKVIPRDFAPCIYAV